MVCPPGESPRRNGLIILPCLALRFPFISLRFGTNLDGSGSSWSEAHNVLSKSLRWPNAMLLVQVYPHYLPSQLSSKVYGPENFLMGQSSRLGMVSGIQGSRTNILANLVRFGFSYLNRGAVLAHYFPTVIARTTLV